MLIEDDHLIRYYVHIIDSYSLIKQDRVLTEDEVLCYNSCLGVLQARAKLSEQLFCSCLEDESEHRNSCLEDESEHRNNPN